MSGGMSAREPLNERESLCAFTCWACGNTAEGDTTMQKWIKKHGNKPSARPLCASCAVGGYFGGS